MKPLFSCLLVLLLVGASSLGLRAQILWSLPSLIHDDTDVLNNGTYFDATQLQANHTVAQTVNGVVFHAFNNTLTDSVITLSNSSEGTDSYSNPSMPLSASYQAILTSTAYAQSPNTGTVIIGSATHPLTIGDQYQVEIWLGAANSRATSYAGVTPLIMTGAQYAVGTFTATATTFDLTYTHAPSSGYGEIDAISVRAVPEPSTWALMLGGLSFLAFAAWPRLTAVRRP